MEPLCHRLRVPCVFLRMVVMCLLVGIVARLHGYSVGFSFVIGVAALVLMQAGYFAGLLYLICQEKKRRK